MAKRNENCHLTRSETSQLIIPPLNGDITILSSFIIIFGVLQSFQLVLTIKYDCEDWWRMETGHEHLWLDCENSVDNIINRNSYLFFSETSETKFAKISLFYYFHVNCEQKTASVNWNLFFSCDPNFFIHDSFSFRMKILFFGDLTARLIFILAVNSFL